MGLTSIIDADNRVVRTRATGVLTSEDFLAGRERLLADPRFDPGYRQLFDLRDVTHVAMSGAAIARVAATSVFRRGVRRAFVGTTPAQYGMARMYSAMSEPHEQLVTAFRDIVVAEAWIHEGRTVS